MFVLINGWLFMQFVILNISIRNSAPIMLVTIIIDRTIALSPIPDAATTGGNSIGPVPISTLIKVLKPSNGLIYPFLSVIILFYYSIWNIWIFISLYFYFIIQLWNISIIIFIFGIWVITINSSFLLCLNEIWSIRLEHETIILWFWRVG